MAVPLSILDLAPVHRHETVADALAGSVHLAQRAEALGYRRVWYAEHHNMPRIASAATSVLIAHVAAQTSTIRLGAGGIMLPNHAPLTIAEQFGTLATLHPGRIELGLGRAPGTDQATMRALRRSPASAQSFPDDVRELQGYLGDVSTIPGVQAIPGAGTHVPLTILGSSLYGAQLAAAFGLPYAFASHFAPAALADAVAIYRDRFEPSDQLGAPHVTVAVNVIAAADDETAQQLLRGTARQRVRLLFSRPGQKLTDEQADLVLDDPAGRGAWDMLGCRAVGTPERVVEQLDELADATGADELILASCAPDRSAAVATVESIARQRLGSGIVAAGLIAAAFPQSNDPSSEPTGDDLAVVEADPDGDGGPDGPAADGDGERDGGGERAGAARTPAIVDEGPDPGADGGDGDETVEVGDGVLRIRLPRGLDETLPAEIAALPDVLAVSVSRSDTLGLVGSWTADGAPRDQLRDGFRIPVGVAAIDPASSAATLALEGVDPALLAIVEELAPGQALLTVSTVEARGLQVGGRIDLDGAAELDVVGVVPDDTAGRTEIMVHRELAESLGMRPGRSLTVRHEAAAGAATGELAAAIEGLVGDPDDIRITDVVDEAVERAARDGDGADGRAPLVLGLPELKATFGEFSYRPRSGVREIDIDPDFVADNIVTARVPLLGNVTCHRAIIDDVAAALDELVDAGLGSWVNPAQYGGCFHARRIATDRDRLSSHSWGAAIDINVDLSMPGLGPVPPDEMIEIFGRHGFRWGGDFTTPDNHHWEWVGERATERRDR